MKMVVYYSHSMVYYNTQKEEAERSYLTKRFEKVICPNRDLNHLESFKDYIYEVDKCSILVASVNNGHVSRGVLTEILRALGDEKRTYILQPHNNSFILLRVRGYKIVNSRDYTNFYAKIFT